MRGPSEGFGNTRNASGDGTSGEWTEESERARKQKVSSCFMEAGGQYSAEIAEFIRN